MDEGILSIQSHVAYGHVGNSAAVFPLQRLGFEVWPVHTVLFSNHTGYGVWRGHLVTMEQVQEIIAGVRERGAIDRCQAVVSGYLGDAGLGEVVLATVAEARGGGREVVYACDPVMGDEGRGFFVRPGIPEFFKDRALPAADLVTPNQFELAWLAERPIERLEDVARAAEEVRRRGPGIVVCTSVEAGIATGELGILAQNAAETWLVITPKLQVTLNGTGDAFTALFLGYWLATRDLRTTLEQAAAAMFGLVAATHEAGSRELTLVSAQDQLVAPDRRFKAERIS